MATHLPPIDFLAGDPVPVVSSPAVTPGADRLPQPVIDELMKISGVDGVWLEKDPGGPVVVLHYTPGGNTSHLPRQVQGMPTRIVGGEPIRALPAGPAAPQ